MQVSPGWPPPLKEAPEEKAEGQGTQRHSRFRYPSAVGCKGGCVGHQLLLSSTTQEVCECSGFSEGSDSYIETFSTISSPSDHFQTVAILPIWKGLRVLQVLWDQLPFTLTIRS